MSEDLPNTYDPHRIKMESFGGFSLKDLTPEELATVPTVITFGVMLRVAASENAKLREEVNTLRANLENAARERENLRVDLASRQRTAKNDWLKVPVATLGGYALYMIAPGLIGFVILVASVTMLTMLHLFNRGKNGQKDSR